eukprot:snap_masked-scaffold_2-processed-gene-26.30-mRNA-1 protein AED:1.00 eAED:1.00 QI:0/0/0/0/1/1/2/0/63
MTFINYIIPFFKAFLLDEIREVATVKNKTKCLLTIVTVLRQQSIFKFNMVTLVNMKAFCFFNV